MPAETQNPKGEERRGDIGQDVGGPEPRETIGKFAAFEEVAEIEDDIRDETAFDETEEGACGIET
jgi:hypothetical protein